VCRPIRVRKPTHENDTRAGFRCSVFGHSDEAPFELSGPDLAERVIRRCRLRPVDNAPKYSMRRRSHPYQKGQNPGTFTALRYSGTPAAVLHTGEHLDEFVAQLADDHTASWFGALHQRRPHTLHRGAHRPAHAVAGPRPRPRPGVFGAHHPPRRALRWEPAAARSRRVPRV